MRAALLTVLGFALPLAPWWAYKWRTFGQPAWDLSLIAVWEGVEGRTWFSLVHLPAFPPLPHGAEAAGLLAAKLGRNLPKLLLAILTGPRALWCGTLVAYVAMPGARRELRVARHRRARGPRAQPDRGVARRAAAPLPVPGARAARRRQGFSRRSR